MFKALLFLLLPLSGVFIYNVATDPDERVVSTIIEEGTIEEYTSTTESILTGPITNPNVPAKTFILEDRNTVVLRGAVRSSSVSKLQNEIIAKDFRLPSGEPIYLVLDTPGGSVFAGLQLIDNLKGLNRKIHTITLFAASMGFQIAQNLDTRYITPTGTLMSHRASVSGFGGQLDGEFESRYKMIKKVVDYLDHFSSKRLKMDRDEYRNAINPELWIHGFEAKSQNAADEVVRIRCGKSLLKTKTEVLQTFFGKATVTFSKCPLISGPVSVEMSNVEINNRNSFNKLIDMLYNKKEDYVREYIVTGKHFQFIND